RLPRDRGAGEASGREGVRKARILSSANGAIISGQWSVASCQYPTPRPSYGVSTVPPGGKRPLATGCWQPATALVTWVTCAIASHCGIKTSRHRYCSQVDL